MKKKILISILACALACATAFALTGCQNADTPTQVVTKALNAAKGGSNFDKFANYVTEDNDIAILKDNVTDLSSTIGSSELTEEEQALMTAFAEKTLSFEFTTGEEKIDGDTATVAVSFKAYDTGAAFENAFKEWFSEAFMMALQAAFGGAEVDQAQATKLFYNKLQTNLDAVTERTFEGNGVITLTKVDKDWKISAIDADGQNAITGNLSYAMNELSNQLNQISS